MPSLCRSFVALAMVNSFVPIEVQLLAPKPRLDIVLANLHLSEQQHVSGQTARNRCCAIALRGCAAGL